MARSILMTSRILQADYSKSKDGAAYEKRAFKGRIKLRPFMFYNNVRKWRCIYFRYVKRVPADQGEFMNIQIFGTKKCNDTKKAERFFKERGIKFQFIDMKEKGMSKGELTSVAGANGGIMNMIDPSAKDKDVVALLQYIADEDKLEKLLENQHIIKTPVVRNGKQSTLGYQPDVWKKWE